MFIYLGKRRKELIIYCTISDVIYPSPHNLVRNNIDFMKRDKGYVS